MKLPKRPGLDRKQRAAYWHGLWRAKAIERRTRANYANNADDKAWYRDRSRFAAKMARAEMPTLLET